MDKRELALFLRLHREKLSPADVGLPAAGPRRTPGLRREEVAGLAHISTQYYTRLEQARGPRPSRHVLAGISRALRLTDAEREHLHNLADEPLGAPPGPSMEVPGNILELIERMPDTAAVVLGARFEVLAWNSLGAALFEDFSALPADKRNIIRRYFLHPDPANRQYGISDGGRFARFAAGRLRAVATRYPHDKPTQDLVAELLRDSLEFARLWPTREVDSQRHLNKTVHHPVVGTMELLCDILEVPERDQHVVLYTAEPGTPSHEALRLLAVIGIQRMDVPT